MDPAWKWEDVHQEALDKVKDLLVKPPVSDYADYLKPFIVHTDSSSYGSGVVLYQKQEGVKGNCLCKQRVETSRDELSRS